MPSTMIHLLTGLAFMRSSNMVKNRSQFLLGCIVPDAVNVYDFAPKEVRTRAHLRSTNLDEWTQNAIDFYTDNLNRTDNDLLLGVVLHAFCDMAWDKRYDSILREAIQKLPLSDEQRFQARWDEFYRFDLTQFNEAWWTSEVKPLLSQSEPLGINGIDANQIADFKAFVINEYQSSIKALNGCALVLTSELVNEFIYYAVAELKNQL